MKSPQKYVPKLTYVYETTNVFIDIAQMLKRAIPPAVPIDSPEPTVHPSTAPIQNNTKEPSVNPAVTPTPSTASTQNDAKEPRVTPSVNPTTDSNLQSSTLNKNSQNNNDLAKRVMTALKHSNMRNKYDPYTKITRPSTLRKIVIFTSHIHVWTDS